MLLSGLKRLSHCVRLPSSPRAPILRHFQSQYRTSIAFRRDSLVSPLKRWSSSSRPVTPVVSDVYYADASEHGFEMSQVRPVLAVFPLATFETLF